MLKNVLILLNDVKNDRDFQGKADPPKVKLVRFLLITILKGALFIRRQTHEQGILV